MYYKVSVLLNLIHGVMNVHYALKINLHIFVKDLGFGLRLATCEKWGFEI